MNNPVKFVILKKGRKTIIKDITMILLLSWSIFILALVFKLVSKLLIKFGVNAQSPHLFTTFIGCFIFSSAIIILYFYKWNKYYHQQNTKNKINPVRYFYNLCKKYTLDNPSQQGEIK